MESALQSGRILRKGGYKSWTGLLVADRLLDGCRGADYASATILLPPACPDLSAQVLGAPACPRVSRVING